MIPEGNNYVRFTFGVKIFLLGIMMKMDKLFNALQSQSYGAIFAM